MNKIHVIGIGCRPFTGRAREVLLKADTVLASCRLHEVFRRYEEFPLVQGKITVINKVDDTMAFLREHAGKRAIVLLASGDPLFFGIGGTLLREFGPACVEILPDLSSVQLAFSAIREPWEDAFLMSLHGGPDPGIGRRQKYGIEDLPRLLERHHKIAILTDRVNNPAVIASSLDSAHSAHQGLLKMQVCEKLGYADEKITSGSPDEIAGMTFADPNVVILTIRQAPKETVEIPETRFGLSEDEIVHARGLITKDEVRAVSIHKLRLPEKGVFWDIGAGSGSVSIEAARLFPGLRVLAIEKNEEQLSNIRANAARFGLRSIEVVPGESPEILRDLPPPDRVFIGGSGGRLPGILGDVLSKMSRGIVVLNAVSLETLHDAVRALADNALDPVVTQIAVSRSKIVSGRRHMAALNPIFIVKGERK